MVKTPLDQKANVNCVGKLGMTSLIGAVKGNHKAVVKTLLDHGADINLKPDGQFDIVTWAVLTKHPAILSILCALCKFETA